MAKITINGQLVKVKKGTTILSAARQLGIDIPTLCFLEEINEIGFCRICVVEVEGEQDLISACNTEITNGMVIQTDSDKVRQSREATLQLLASRHRFDCWRCPKDGMCEFYDLLKSHDVVFEEFGPGIGRSSDLIAGSGISQDQSKCVLCKRCVAVCQNVVTANVLKFRDDDDPMNPIVSPTPGLAFDDAGCIFCGQCVKACPTGTLFETDHTNDVLTFLRNKDDHVVVQLDTRVNGAIAESFGYDIDTPFEETFGKTVKALELLGFDTVTTLDYGEDYHARATAEELLKRLEDHDNLPLFTSSCPASTRFLELYEPERLDHIATVKSPHILQGSQLKHKLLKQKPANTKVVTLSSCTAKKYERTREELATAGVADVDAALTVREITKLMKQKGIAYRNLEAATPDPAVTSEHVAVQGGVLVAVLNAAHQIKTGEPLAELAFKHVHGEKESDGFIEEATVQLGEAKLNVARVIGGAAFKELFARSNKKNYHLIEFLMCPGGCLNGGGMPIHKNLTTHEVIARREMSYCDGGTDLPLSNPLHNHLVDANYADDPNIHTGYSQKEYRKE